jgi:hypothetical protein
MRLNNYIPDKPGTQQDLDVFTSHIYQQGRLRFHIPDRSLPSSQLERAIDTLRPEGFDITELHVKDQGMTLDIYLGDSMDDINARRDALYKERTGSSLSTSLSFSGDNLYGREFGGIDIYSNDTDNVVAHVHVIRDALELVAQRIGLHRSGEVNPTQVELMVNTDKPIHLTGVLRQLQRKYDHAAVLSRDLVSGNIIDQQTGQLCNYES